MAMEEDIFCNVCQINLKDVDIVQEDDEASLSSDEANFLTRHLQSPEHRLCFLQDYYSTNRSEMIENKNHVIVSIDNPEQYLSSPNFVEQDENGKIIIQLLKDEPDKTAKIYIYNESEQSAVIIEEIQCLYTCDRITIDDEHNVTGQEKKIKLNEGGNYVVNFTATGGDPCVQELPLVFELSIEGQETFYILRILVIEVLEAFCESETLVPLKQREKILENMHVPPQLGTYIPGYHPDRNDKQLKRLYEYYPPQSIRDIFEAKFKYENLTNNYQKKELKRVRRLMNAGLNKNNYEEWFQTQLWIEELSKESDLKMYHQICVGVQQVNNSYSSDIGTKLVKLHVPGLLEKRPGLLRMDSVFFRPTGVPEPIYEGIVHFIDGEYVHLGFNGDFCDRLTGGLKVDVQFWFNRQSFIRCHIALSKNHFVTDILFPPEQLRFNKEEHQFEALTLFDERVNQNTEQRQAVNMIVNEVSKPYPYILFGPPGTGKTLTMVEAIKQVYHKTRVNTILVCGPSNSACDMITERLLTDVKENHILRIHAVSRDVRTLSAAVRRVSLIDENVVSFPSMDRISTYRVVVATFTTAFKIIPIFQQKEAIQGFSHVFLDECGHGMEPEALIPLMSLADQIVLAGDPKQLGPVISSKYCHNDSRYFRGAGLNQSLLERLMNLDPYKPRCDGTFNKIYVTKLLNNFRSHKKILAIPNRLFYNSELRSKADKKLVNSMLNFNLLPSPKIPIIFHGVNGRDNREKGNPSYFNEHEVSEVVKYLKVIGKTVNLEDIGIITPYKSQIKKIRTAVRYRTTFDCRELKNLRIGSPEEFQGDERKVIIVSTVRASAEHLLNDQSLQLGFLRNPKRFNVVITRAQALLIVIGCPWLLIRDVQWGAFLKFAKRNNCYTGCPFKPLESDQIDEIYNAYQDLKIDVGADSLE